jgi:glucose-1-phosphate cytidylyltransferase
MKVGILSGGMGTRLAEESTALPKPMVDIAGRPILWHIMDGYARQGHSDFVVALGYKGETVKEYFANYQLRNRSLRIQLRTGEVSYLDGHSDDWDVTLLDTGITTQTGGRVKRIARHLAGEPFLCTYGDGLTDVDIGKLIDFHRANGRVATVTAVPAPARFGSIVVDGARVTAFSEKPMGGEGWINGGFFVFEPEIANYIESDDTLLEHEPMMRLAEEGQLAAYKHEGFWQCMDTPRDVRLLNSLCTSGTPPWQRTR